MDAKNASRASEDGFARALGERILAADDPLALFLEVYAPEMLAEWQRVRDQNAELSPALSRGGQRNAADGAGEARVG